MNGKDLAKEILSRKFAVAAIGIFALCYIASAVPIAVDEEITLESQVDDWAIPAMITLITCLAIIMQGVLDSKKQGKNDKAAEVAKNK